MKIAIAGTGHIGISNAILRAQHNEEVALGAVAGKRVASPFFYGVETRNINKAVSAKARQGKIANFTGIESPYEAPEAPEVTLNPDCPLGSSFPRRRESSKNYNPRSGQNLGIGPLRGYSSSIWIPACAGMTGSGANELFGLNAVAKNRKAASSSYLSN